MREINFRVWNPKRKLMVYDANDINLGTDVVLEVLNGRLEASYLSDISAKENWKRAELMQYTGLKDRNGKGIYEGDIIKRPVDMVSDIHGDFTYQEIIYRNGTWVIQYLLSEKGKILPTGYTAGLLIDCFDQDMKTIVFEDEKLKYTDVEVVGNVYENPELI